MRTLTASGLLLCATSLSACSINVDTEGFIVREEKRFAVEGIAELTLQTFDGGVEVRGWDRPEVLVEIEMRAEDKEAVSKITVLAEQTGQKIQVEARTTDGTIRVSGIPGVVRARSGDGSIVLRIRRGAVMTEDWMVATNDGSISAELPDDFSGLIEAEPGSDSRARSDLKLEDQVGGTREQRSLRGRLGAGGKTMVLRTGDGSIRLTQY